MEKLQTTTVTHLDHEEAETEPALAQHDDDPAVKEMGKKFGRRIGWPRRASSSPGCRTAPRPGAEAALRDSVPGPVLAIIGGVFGRRYRKEVAPVWAGSASR